MKEELDKEYDKVLRRDSNGEMSHMSSEEDMVSCERSAFILARKLDESNIHMQIRCPLLDHGEDPLTIPSQPTVFGTCECEPNLAQEEVLDLQAELYDGFSEPEFQEALRELEAIHGKAYRNYTDDHTKLFLTVQNKVLPRYGFDKGQAGVLQMLSVGARYNDNEEFCSNRALLNVVSRLCKDSKGLGTTESSFSNGALLGPAANQDLEWRAFDRAVVPDFLQGTQSGWRGTLAGAQPDNTTCILKDNAEAALGSGSSILMLTWDGNLIVPAGQKQFFSKAFVLNITGQVTFQEKSNLIIDGWDLGRHCC
eukprot:g31466.t2